MWWRNIILLFFFLSVLIATYKTKVKKSQYGKIKDFYRNYVRMAASIAFLSAKNVISGFKFRKTCNSGLDITECLEYFEKSNTGVPQQIGTGRGALIFAVSEWNVYQVKVSRKNETNDICGGVEQNFPQCRECKTSQYLQAHLPFEKLTGRRGVKSKKNECEWKYFVQKETKIGMHSQTRRTLVLNYHTGKTDIINFFSVWPITLLFKYLHLYHRSLFFQTFVFSFGELNAVSFLFFGSSQITNTRLRPPPGAKVAH